jgi:hypothetical protein
LGKNELLFRGQEQRYTDDPLQKKGNTPWSIQIWLTKEREKAEKAYATNWGWLFTYNPVGNLRLLYIHSRSYNVVKFILEPIAVQAQLGTWKPWAWDAKARTVIRSSSHSRDALWAGVFCPLAHGANIDGYYATQLVQANGKGIFHSEVMICYPKRKLVTHPKENLQLNLADLGLSDSDGEEESMDSGEIANAFFNRRK